MYNKKGTNYRIFAVIILILSIIAALYISAHPAKKEVIITIPQQGTVSIKLSNGDSLPANTFVLGPEMDIQQIRNNKPGRILIVVVRNEATVLEDDVTFQIHGDFGNAPTIIEIDGDTIIIIDNNQLSSGYFLTSTHIAFELITPQAPTNSIPPTLAAIFSEIDIQFQNTLDSSIAFNKPTQMKKDETASIELILNPSLSESALATKLVDQSGFVTSTAEPNVLIAPNGETVTVTTSQVEITPRMKAELKPQDPEAFTVTEMHDNAEQVVSSVETTAWRWSVTAKKEGSQTLELVIYQLVKYDGKDYWHEVETYKANIVVEVALGDRVKSLDWKWIAGFIITLVGAIIGVWKWLDERKKKAAESKPSAPVRRVK